MSKVVLSTLSVFTAIVAGLPPVLACAHALDSQLDCKSTAHAFIAPLMDERYIESKPMRVEANSVNAFRPTRGSHLTAFGFPVNVVLGYQRDDVRFRHGSGQPINDSAYGAVVTGPAESVQERVHRAGSSAVVQEVIPLILTAIFCDGH